MPDDRCPTTSLSLEGAAPDGTLLVQTRGSREAQPISLRYRLNPETGAQTPQPECTSSALTLKTARRMAGQGPGSRASS